VFKQRQKFFCEIQRNCRNFGHLTPLATRHESPLITFSCLNSQESCCRCSSIPFAPTSSRSVCERRKNQYCELTHMPQSRTHSTPECLPLGQIPLFSASNGCCCCCCSELQFSLFLSLFLAPPPSDFLSLTRSLSRNVLSVERNFFSVTP
jgi:hypothetical protein